MYKEQRCANEEVVSHFLDIKVQWLWSCLARFKFQYSYYLMLQSWTHYFTFLILFSPTLWKGFPCCNIHFSPEKK